MAKVVFNNQNPTTKGYTLLAYNRNTIKDPVTNNIQCSAYVQIDAVGANITQLMTDFNNTITRITLYDDEGVMSYDLTNLTATITSISETWNGSKVDVYLNIDTGSTVAPAAPVAGD